MGSPFVFSYMFVFHTLSYLHISIDRTGEKKYFGAFANPLRYFFIFTKVFFENQLGYFSHIPISLNSATQ